MRITFARLHFFAAATILLAGAGWAAAQTYTPQHIVVESDGATDKAEVLRIAGLKDGAAVTKEEIEAALGRLADSGSFSDLSYSVNSTALTLHVVPVRGAQAMPVRYTNFVWWSPQELTAKLQERVPLYHGEMPGAGPLTDKVEAAAVGLLADRGILNAEVTTSVNQGMTQVGLTIERPQILIGKVEVGGSLPQLKTLLESMQKGFRGEEFDQRDDAIAVPQNVSDLYHNAGYLDATADPAVFAPPRKEGSGSATHYTIDASTTVHPGSLYKLRTLTLNGPAPLTKSDLEKAAVIKPGDPAGTAPLEHARFGIVFAYSMRGYLNANAEEACVPDKAALVVDCTYTATAGALHHVAGFDTTALSTLAQAEFARRNKVSIGVVADAHADMAIEATLKSMEPGTHAHSSVQRDSANATVIYVIKPYTPHAAP